MFVEEQINLLELDISSPYCQKEHHRLLISIPAHVNRIHNNS